jgi:hypothetical protein
VDLDKVPTYSLFKKTFTEDIDIHLAKIILNDSDARLTQEIKTEFKKMVDVINPETNILKCQYRPRYDLGRRYADYPEPKLPNGKTDPNYGKVHSALISQPRLIKNTIFKYHDYIDIDQKKGHPTIIYCNAKKNNIELPTYKEYLDNFDSYVDQISAYYSVDGKKPLDKKDIKLLFNRTIYGGGHDNWVDDIIKGKVDDAIECIKNEDTVYKREPKEMKNMRSPHPFYKKFHDETTQIIDLVYSSNKNIAKRVCKDLSNDPSELWKKKSRTMSYFCGIVENEITFQAYKYLQKNGLIYDRHLDWGLDGLTLPRFEGDVDEVLDDLNDYVRKQTKFSDVKFVLKEFDDDEILHNALSTRNDMMIDEDNVNLEEPEPISDIVTFKSVSDSFEKTHCKIINKSIFIKQTSEENLVFSKIGITTSYEHVVYERRKKVKGEYEISEHSFIKDWLSCNPNQKRYDDMILYPNVSMCPSNHFNLWVPFKCSTIEEYKPRPKALNLILSHIKVLCDNEIEVYEYFCKWIGQMLKYPEIKPGLCPTLISKQGAGKGTLMSLLRGMMGNKKVLETTDPNRDVWGNFNGSLCDAFLVNLNELSKKDTIGADGKIKGLLTDPVMTINNKGVNQFEIASYHRFIITSNKDEPIAIQRDNRRHMVIRSSDEKIGDKPYFETLYNYIKSPDVLKTCFEHFINLPDLDIFHTLPVPVTEYQKDTQSNCECPVRRWLEYYVTSRLATKDKTNERGEIEVLGGELHNSFNNFCSENCIEYKINTIAFCLKMKRLGLRGIIKGRRTNKGSTTLLNITGLREELNIKDMVLLTEDDFNDNSVIDRFNQIII